MSDSLPSVSIIINTLNRAPYLQKTLNSLRWLKYNGAVEVIVVNGPSTDNTEHIINSWLPFIRTAKCDVANLSISRNIGICLAKGDIVAFLDDDAIPEPEWLSQLVEPYQDPNVGASGGVVYDNSGYNYQYRYSTIDRLGNPDFTCASPTPHLCFPKSARLPYIQGCNSSFRKSALLEIGGFDEEYDYFLDETDVCLRIVDAGYLIKQLPNAYVYHDFAPNAIRGLNKITCSYYSIIKNKTYFMLRHALDFYTIEYILKSQQNYIQEIRESMQRAREQSLIRDSDIRNFEVDAKKALYIGLKNGTSSIISKITPNKLRKHKGKFLPFHFIKQKNFETHIFVSQEYEANEFINKLAESGNIVHVITESKGKNHVYFENGIWMHELTISNFQFYRLPNACGISDTIFQFSSVALTEIKRISKRRAINSIRYLDPNVEKAVSVLNTIPFESEEKPEIDDLNYKTQD